MRKWIANKLAGWARRIYPESDEYKRFLIDRMTEMIITGQSTIKITAENPYKEEVTRFSLRT